MSSRTEFDDERSLARILVEKISLGRGAYFREVTQIPSGDRIEPDIDLLRIMDKRERKRVIGYEIKVLRYNTRYKVVPLTPFYTGLGKALGYFRHGVDRVELIVGLHSSSLKNSHKIERTIADICRFLGKRIILPIPLTVSIVRNGKIRKVFEGSMSEGPAFDHEPDANQKRSHILHYDFLSKERFTM